MQNVLTTKMNNMVSEFEAKMAVVESKLKQKEDEFTRLAEQSRRQQGTLPGKVEQNPRKDVYDVQSSESDAQIVGMVGVNKEITRIATEQTSTEESKIEERLTESRFDRSYKRPVESINRSGIRSCDDLIESGKHRTDVATGLIEEDQGRIQSQISKKNGRSYPVLVESLI